MKRRVSAGTAVIYGILSLYVLVCLIPFLLVIAVSVTDEASLLANGARLWPEKFSLTAYRLLLGGSSQSLGRSYLVTVLSTLVGTTLAMLITSLAAFVLNNPAFKGRGGISFYFFFTMLFNGGMVPWYLINRRLGLYDNFWALVVPTLLFSPYNMFLVRNYMKTLPASLMESARLDGANEAVIALKIYLPLSVPVLAAVALFYGVAYWNSWWNAIMLIDDAKWRPLQFLLLNIRSALKGLELSGVSNIRVPGQPVQNATTLVTIGPIILLYPWLQRYFIKGIVIGAVKG